MKKKLSLFGLLTLGLLIFFISCEKDDETFQTYQNSSHLKTTKVSFDQVLNELSDNEIKQKVNFNKTLFQSNSINNSFLRSNNDYYDFFIKKQKDDILTTYILNINSYSQNTPYFLKLIITKNENETERLGYLKYIPSNSSSSLDLSIFTGEIQILDSEFEITATSTYINGIKQETSQDNNSSNRMVCTDEILITEVKCTNGGAHGVGETCKPGFINNAYYEISIFTRCNEVRTNPVQIIEDTGSPDSGTTSFSNTAYLLPFLNSLTTEEISIYLDNPFIQDYLVQNLIVAPIPNCDPMLGGDCTQVIIEPQAEQFANELIDYLNYYNITLDNELNDVIDFNNKIFYLIDKPCQNQIVKDILNVSSPLTNLINQTFNTSEKVNIKFSNGNLPDNDGDGVPDSNAYTNPFYSGNSGNFSISIRFDNSFLEASTDLGIVAVTLHELIHAQLMQLYIKGELISASTEYEDLLNAFIAFYNDPNQNTFDPLDNEIHNAMNNFIEQIGNSIYNYANSKNINVSAQYCVNLAWGTMSGSQLFEEVLTQTEQINNNNIFAYEQDNMPQAAGTACN